MMEKTDYVIVIDPSKCTGCHGCEMACSMGHFGKNGTFYSRIRIQEFRDICTFIPVTCQACEEAPCIKVCPMGARKRIESGAVITDEDACIGCQACIYACPLGAPVMNPDTGKTMSCDQCLDDEDGPACARACTMQGALKYVPKYQASKDKASKFAWSMKDEFKPQGTGDEKNTGVGFA